MNTAVMFSSETDLWATPQAFFDLVNREFHFTIDVCATPDNAKCAVYYTPEQNGLAQHWQGRCWMNPPYGRKIGLWIRKAHESAAQGAVVVGLLPARTDTAWFHNYIYGHAEIRFVRGRLKFGKLVTPAPFPSMIAIWRPK